MDNSSNVHFREPESWVVEKAWQGNGKAFNELITRHRSRALQIVKFFCEDTSSAYAIARKAFILTLLSAYKLRTPDKFLAHLVRTIEDISVNPHAVLTPEELQASQVCQPSRIPAAVSNALDKMSEDHRLVILLKDMCGLNYSTIASALQVPVFVLEIRLAEARSLFGMHYIGSAAEDEEVQDEV